MKFFKVYKGVFYKVVVRLFFLVPDFLHRKPLPNKLRFKWGLCFGLSHKGTAKRKNKHRSLRGAAYHCMHTYIEIIDIHMHLSTIYVFMYVLIL